MNCGIISATCQSSQTTTIDNEWLRNAAKLIEKGKIDADRVKLLNEMIGFLNQRIAVKDSIAASFSHVESAQDALIESYKLEVKNLEEQRDIAVREMKAQNKKYRRQKRRTVFAGIGAAGVTAALFIFLK